MLFFKLFCILAEEATVIEIDHDARQVYSETMKVAPGPVDVSLLVPSQDQVTGDSNSSSLSYVL